MIAIVILGLGLMVVATMFPIAWSKAREQAEFTTAVSCATIASNTVPMVTRVSDLLAPATGETTVSSFFGDVYVDAAGVLIASDPWVHALHLQNLIIEAPNLPDPALPLYGDFAEPNPAAADNANDYLNPVGPDIPTIAYQVAFQDRAYPPLANPAGLAGPALARWQELLRQRRFCWAVLHKLNYDPVLGTAPTATDRRTFTMYYVTLRRGQPTHRYARQNPTNSISAYIDPADINKSLTNDLTGVSPPVALLPDNDALLPVPWRVEIEVPDPATTTPGLPTEAYTNLGGNSNRLITEMLPAGAWMIDERNGLIYRVAKRDIDPDNPEEAVLTLDQEIPAQELDDDGDGTAGVPTGELIRTVWVFPPAVDATRGAGGLPIFIGPQPVVRIDVQTVTFSP